MSKEWDEKLGSKKFNVEHAIAMEVRRSVIMPVRYLYEPEKLEEFSETLAHCHIYMIGHMPIVIFDRAEINGRFVVTKWEVSGKVLEDHTDVGVEGCSIKIEENGGWWIVDPNGNQHSPTELLQNARQRLSDEHGAVQFEILYIGQAFGKDGSRQAMDRLLQGHEKLQEICIRGVPEGQSLYLLLIDLEPGTNLSTIINPRAQDKDNTYERLLKGFEAQAETTEAEKTTLYEASLIKYFEPPYNKEFKKTFPSTNMTLLQGCYAKDINSIIAEVNIDALFQLKSGKVPANKHHIAGHELHSDAERKIFFGLE